MSFGSLFSSAGSATASGSTSSESSSSSSFVALSSFSGVVWSSVSSTGVVSSLFSVVESLAESSTLVVSFTSAGFSVEVASVLFSSKGRFLSASSTLIVISGDSSRMFLIYSSSLVSVPAPV